MAVASVVVLELPARCDIVVLGAGPVGLATAWYASRRGMSVVVVDRAAHVGGLAGSFFVDHQSVDYGSHRLHPSIRGDLLDDLRSLGVHLQWRPRRGRIRMMGRWLTFPLSPRDLALHAPKGFATRVVIDTLAAPARRARRRRESAEPISFADAARRGLGPAITDAFYEPYARKLWSVSGDGLSADLFRRRVSAGSTAAIMRRALRPGTRAGFWYPAGGFGSISEALADGIVAVGGIIALGETPTAIATISTAISTASECCSVELASGSTVSARSVVSTIPAASLLELVGAPDPVREAALRLRFRGAVLVYLSVPRATYTPFDAHYFPERSTIIGRLSEPKHYRTSDADPADHTVLCAEIPADPGDDVWQSDDESLVRRVERELVRNGLPHPSTTTWHVVRRSHVYPVYRVGYEIDAREVARHLDGLANLAVVGRQATFAHDNTHHALLMGETLAASLNDDGTLDAPAWHAARRAFDDHVVED